MTLRVRRYHFWIQHRPARLSAGILCVLCILGILAPLIANEKPLLIYYKGKLHSPLFKNYTEDHFGGTLPIHPDYKDTSLQQGIKKEGWILWAPITYSPVTRDHGMHGKALLPPSRSHIAGTDDQGRDLFVRILYALRFSLAFGICFACISIFLGTVIGALQGYYAGLVDLVGQRLVELITSIPLLIALMLLATLFPLNFFSLLLIFCALKWVLISPLMRAAFLQKRTAPYVKAAHVLGATGTQKVMKHILPNVLFLPLTKFPFLVLSGTSLLTALDFFGMPLPESMTTFGEILIQARQNPSAPWILYWSMGSLLLLFTPLVFLGDALQHQWRRTP